MDNRMDVQADMNMGGGVEEDYESEESEDEEGVGILQTITEYLWCKHLSNVDKIGRLRGQRVIDHWKVRGAQYKDSI